MFDYKKVMDDLAAVGAGFDLIGDHIIITDFNGTIIYANEAAERSTGYSRADIIGKKPGELWGGAMPNSFYEALWKRIKTNKEAFIGDVKNRRPDGSEVWQELRIFPVLGEEGNVVAYIGVEPIITLAAKPEPGGDSVAQEKSQLVDTLLSGFIARGSLKLVELKKEMTDFRARLNKLASLHS